MGNSERAQLVVLAQSHTVAGLEHGAAGAAGAADTSLSHVGSVSLCAHHLGHSGLLHSITILGSWSAPMV